MRTILFILSYYHGHFVVKSFKNACETAGLESSDMILSTFCYVFKSSLGFAIELKFQFGVV